MRILVTGATGFVGRPLVRRLLVAGHEVEAFSRDSERAAAVLPARCRVDGWHPREGVGLSHLPALDAVIQLFYLRRDGVAIDGTPYATRQLDRADAIFRWLAGELAADRRGFGDGFGLAELSLICALDWMDFRGSYPTERAEALSGVRGAWADRASVSATRPHA